MLYRRLFLLSAFFCSLSLHAATTLKNVELKDLFFGEVLYYSHQDSYFEALSRLDAELLQYSELDEAEMIRHRLRQMFPDHIDTYSIRRGVFQSDMKQHN